VVTPVDIAWAAGIFEGEGTCPRRSKSNRTTTASVTQKDLWLLHRMQSLFGGTVRQYPQKEGTYGRWSCSGERARGFVMTIYTLMSPRRRAQIRAALFTDYPVAWQGAR
jgi:hypothetical protein